MSKNIEIKTCYMCDLVATSKEHAPPQSFFPKTADQCFRKELITVPSCKIHNQDTSSTDELMRYLFYFGSLRNEASIVLGTQILNGKSQNLGRHKVNITKLTYNEYKITPLQERSLSNVASFNITHLKEPLHIFINKLSCALYHHETSKKINQSLKHCYSLFVSKQSNSDEVMHITNITDRLFADFKVPYQGSNPLVFKYRILEIKELIILQFVFFESIVISNQFI